MKFIADFHLHSKYSRATSKAMDLENLDKWAKIKGIRVLGTGDFTHPEWFKNLKEKLEPVEPGLFKLKNFNSETRFILTVEISCIYSKKNRVRRIHILIFAPSFAAVEKINAHLGWIGNLKADGRPILGLDAKELAKIALDASEDCLVVPAHCLLPNESIHTENGTKEIRYIQKGDRVYTHTGRLRRVKKLYSRAYKGPTIRIRPWYFRPGLTTTPEHPFFAIKTQKHCWWQHGFCRRGCSGKQHCCKRHKAEEFNFQPRWIQAKDLEKSDVLLFPRFRETVDINSFFLSSQSLNMPGVVTPVFSWYTGTQTITMRGTRSHVLIDRIPINKEFCRLTGYFIAEGSVNGRDAISFTFASHEQEYQEDVKQLMQQLFGIRCAKERKRWKSTELIFYSKIIQHVFSLLFYSDDGIHWAHTKALPQWMLLLPQKKQAEIFRCWWRGDTGYTTSRILMNQMKIIALRLGIIPSILKASKERFNRGIHKIEGRKIKAYHDLFQFSGLAFSQDKFGLRNEPFFQNKRFMPKLNRRHGWIDENYIYMPIRDIEINDYDGDVYNLEVEDDNSYVSEFATIHNCWTPWFSIFGSKSGFDSIEECFEEYAKYIYAGETGLSSDPAMNWRLSNLDKITLISNSDAHSAQKIGREANMFDTELSYPAIADVLKTKDRSKLLYTIEFFPEEGKYHYDGHRACGVSLSPSESKKYNNICPNCGKPLTIGVLNRVEELADRPGDYRPGNAIPFKSLIPLEEIIAEAIGTLPGTKRGKEEYKNLISKFGSEFQVLLETTANDLKNSTLPGIAEGILKVRDGKVNIDPGYDGVYGKIKIFSENEQKILSKQKTLF